MSNDALTENGVRDALLASKGDMIQAHRALGVSLGRLSSFTRSIPRLRRLMAEMDREKDDPEYDNITREQFASNMTALTAAYQIDGLNTIHELAMRDDDGVASMAEVRLKAAVQLRGNAPISQNSAAGILSELNDLYVETASRVKNLRATATLTVSLESADQGQTVALPARLG